MRSASAVLSNDSGPAHLSIALGTPTVVVVGGGHFGSFVPYPADRDAGERPVRLSVDGVLPLLLALP